MRATWVGAAMVAAVACGWAQGAEASIVTFDAGTSVTDYDYVELQATFDTEGKSSFTGLLSGSSFQAFLDGHPEEGNLNVPFITYSGTFSSKSDEDSQFGPSYRSYRLTLDTNVGNFTADAYFSSLLALRLDYVDLDGPHQPGYFSRIFPGGTATLNGASFTFSIAASPVPLPAAAPLLGAALVAFGGLGFARRHSRHVA